eukprot:gene9699-biopygen7989
MGDRESPPTARPMPRRGARSDQRDRSQSGDSADDADRRRRDAEPRWYGGRVDPALSHWRKGVVSHWNTVKHVGTIWDTKEFYFTHRSAFKTTRGYPRPQTDDKVLWWPGVDRKNSDRIAAVRVCLLDELDDQPSEFLDSVAKDFSQEDIMYFRNQIVPDRPPKKEKSRDKDADAGRHRERDGDRDRRRDRDRDDMTWRRDRAQAGERRRTTVAHAETPRETIEELLAREQEKTRRLEQQSERYLSLWPIVVLIVVVVVVVTWARWPT